MRNISNIKMLLATVLGSLIFFVCAASAQVGSSNKTGALLWRISGNGLAHPSYVFGTHHLFPYSFLDSVAGVKRVFAESRQIVGEVVMQDMAALSFVLQQASMMPPDTTWQMLLAEDDLRFVDEQLIAAIGLGLQTLSALKPAMVGLTYTMMLYMRIFPGVNPAESLDMWFQEQAIAREIPVLGLEKAQDQTAALFISSLKRQAEDFLCSLRNADYTLNSVHKLNRLYRSADLTAMAAMLREENPCPMSAQQEAAINDERNNRWLEKLPTMMADKPSFIAVGALHLAGEAGILTGLERLGFTVEAVVE